MTAVRPGPSTNAGLQWLVKVGTAPLGAWGIAMCWGERAVYSHARRLREAGLLEMCPKTRGEGTLVYATRAGVRLADVTAAVVDRKPAAVTWPHCEACAWTAAWLTTRGREMVGPREMLVQPQWREELHWHEHGETRRRAHRPDLACRLPDGAVLPIEVELTDKSPTRLKAVLALHAEWVVSGQSAALIYVCASEPIREHVIAEGEQAGFSVTRGTLRVELLETIQREAVEARPQLAATEWHIAGTAVA